MIRLYHYVPVSDSDIPSAVRFDVPGCNQGQHIEIAFGGFSTGEHDIGDPYKRVTDEMRRVSYYRLVDTETSNPAPANGVPAKQVRD